jgi:branched-chain amino acid transport system substrate-binding protein
MMEYLLTRHLERMPKVLIGSAALLLTLVSVAACGGSSSSSGSSAGSGSSSNPAPYNVDIISSLTGTDSQGGVPADDAYKTVIDYVNAHGGINGHKINVLHTYDDQSSATVATNLAREAVGDHPVAILFGAAASAEGPAVLPIFENAKIPVFSTALYPFGLFPWSFTEQPTPGQFATLVANDAQAAAGGNLTGKKVAFITAASPAGQSIAAAAKSAIAALGGTLVTSQFQTVGAVSFTSGAANILSSGAQIVVSGDVQPSTVIEAKALIAAGFKGPIRSVSQGDPSTLQEIDSPQYEGALEAAGAVPGTGMYAAANEYGTVSGTSSGVFSDAWIHAYLLIEGLQACTYPCDPSALEKAEDSLGSFTIPGNVVFGPLHISATDHNAITVAQNYAWDPKTKSAVKVGATISLGNPVYPAASGS